MNIIEKFEMQVKKNPQNVALLSECEGKMTYEELNDFANSIAEYIDDCNLEQEDIIAVCINRSFTMIASILGILKSGHAYLPIDASYPERRIEFMLKQTNVKMIITSAELEKRFTGYPHILIVDNLIIYGNSENKIREKSELFCIIYSSGSTGEPNGVTLTNKSVNNTVEWAIDFYQLSEEDVSLQIPSCSFVSSVQDYFSTLLSGGSLFLLQESDLLHMKKLSSICSQYKVTHFDMVPSLYKEFLKYISYDNNLRFVLLAGEPLDINLVQEHFHMMDQVKLVNEYGMSETSSCFSYFELSKNSTEVLIGKPIDNMQYRIEQDEEGVGELFIKGPGIAKGYYNNATYTKKRFVEYNGETYLRTGDYVKVCNDGNLKYVGRKDNQIKINGKRIDLSEIDSHIKKFDNVEECITIAIEKGNKKNIVTFIVSEEENVDYFYDELKSLLPKHFIPNDIIILESLVYLPNRKVDVNRLKKLYLEKERESSTIPNTYAEIYKIIRKYLLIEKEQVDIYANLHDIGIDSISIIGIIAELEEVYQIKIEYEYYKKMDKLSIKKIKDMLERHMERKNVDT